MNRRLATLGSTVLASLPWVYALLIVVSSMAAPVEEFDDAIPLVLGALVQHGAIPTIDFRSFYPPLGPYVTAAAFNLFGRTVVAPRILGGVIYLLVLVLLARLLARRSQEPGPSVGLTILLVAATLGRVIAIPAWPGFGLAMVALLVYLLSQQGGGFARLTLGLSGALTGLALLYRVNFGGYVVLIIAADLMIEGWPINRLGWQAGRWRQPLLKGVIFIAPMLACLSIFCFGIYGNRLVEGISEFTVTSQKLMSQYRFVDLRWSFKLAGALLLPAVWFSLRLLSNTGKLSWRFLPAFALGLGVLTLAVARGHHASVVAILVLCQFAGVIVLHFLVLPLSRLERVFLLFYVLQLHYYLSRADHMHLKFLPFAAVLLLALLWPERVRARESENVLFSRGLVLAGSAALIWAVFWPQAKVSLSNLGYGIDLLTDVSLHRGVADSDRVLGSAATGTAWEFVYPAPDELRALRHLREVTASTDPIFVGVQNHSKIFYNNLRIYWLSGRPIGAREFQLEDRIATEAAVQRAIVRDLNQNHVNWAIVDRKQDEGDAPFVRRAYTGSTLLDTFILENFQEESHFGQYAILRRTRMAP